jgi:peptidase E
MSSRLPRETRDIAFGYLAGMKASCPGISAVHFADKPQQEVYFDNYGALSQVPVVYVKRFVVMPHANGCIPRQLVCDIPPTI